MFPYYSHTQFFKQQVKATVTYLNPISVLDSAFKYL